MSFNVWKDKYYLLKKELKKKCLHERKKIVSVFRKDLKNIEISFKTELPNSFVEDIIQPYEKKWEKVLSDPKEKNELSKGS